MNWCERKRSIDTVKRITEDIDGAPGTVAGSVGPADLELIDDMLLEKSHGWALTLEMRGAMRKELFDSVRRLDVIQDLIDDPKVTEIMVNGFDRIFVERGGIVSR